ncbi:GGDEF domain-containing protein, partial [Xanthomonas sp. Kuri4-2]
DERRANERLNGLILLDVDRFKEVNDRYGHAAGDTALADLATILRFEVRGEDQVFRFGGEEFVVLLRVESLAELEATTERLRKSVRTSLRSPGGQITVSLGAARHSGETHWQDWFSRADAALYIAKNSGRDSYRLADRVL